MSALAWVVATEPTPTCGARSSKSDRAMSCELPPEHLINGEQWTHHFGRDCLGRWRSWVRAA